MQTSIFNLIFKILQNILIHQIILFPHFFNRKYFVLINFYLFSSKTKNAVIFFHWFKSLYVFH